MARGGWFIGPAEAPDRYELVVVVDGSGFEGVVWRGYANFEDPRPQVALKIYRPERVASRGLEDTCTQLFELTARMRALRHSGLAVVHDPFIGAPPHARGQQDSTAPLVLCLPMDYIDGVGFNEWCTTEPSLGARLRMLANAGDALDQMHARQLVHADIKPSNIMIETDPLPRSVLVDYGLVRLVSDTTAGGRTIGGTPGYWAPEARNSGNYSKSSDLYAFACTIVFAVSGTHPPESADLQMWAQSGLTAAGLGPRAVESLVRALAPNPGDRDPEATAASLLAQAGQSRTTTPGKTAATNPPPVPTPAPAPIVALRRRRTPMVVAALMIVGVVAAGLWFSRADRDDAVDAGATAAELSSTPQTAPPVTESAVAPAETLEPATTLPETTAPLPETTAPPPETTVPPPPAVYLSNLEVAENSYWLVDDLPVDSNGMTYPYAVVVNFSGCEEVVEPAWNLGGGYTRFQAVVGVNTAAATRDVRALVRIRNEASTDLWAGEVSLTSQIPIDVDVTGVLRLIVSITRLDGGTDCGINSVDNFVVLGNAQLLSPGAVPIAAQTPTSVQSAGLEELRPVEDSYWVREDDLPVAAASGQTFAGGAVIKFSGCEEVVSPSWDLSRGYSRFEATAAMNAGATTDALANVKLTTETGAVLWNGDVSFATNEPIVLDVNGVLRLTATVSRLGGGNDCGIGSSYNTVLLGDGRIATG